MNIVLINHYAGSDYHGMEFRPFYMAKQWMKQGHDVTIIAATHSHLRKVNPNPDTDFSEEYIDNVRYLWVKTPKYTRNDPFRALNIAVFINKLKLKAKYIAEKYKPDAVIASSTYPPDIRPAEKIAKAANARLYFEIHDLWPLSPMVLYNISEKNPLIQYLQRAEDYAFEKAHKIISILPNADLHIKERGANTSKFVYIPNGVVINTEQEPAPSSHTEFINQRKEQGRFIVMYLGGFAEANALDELVHSAKDIDDNIDIVLVGDGVKKQEYIEYCTQNNLNNIFFLDSVNKKSVTAVLSLADCLYIGAKRCALYKYGVGMNKLYDYMLSKKPIISGVEASNNPVRDYNCGITVKAEDKDDLVRAINQMAQTDEQTRIMMGENGYQYVIENHDYEKLSQKFIDALR